jgi:small-conductance mechanosensitive channel
MLNLYLDNLEQYINYKSICNNSESIETRLTEYAQLVIEYKKKINVSSEISDILNEAYNLLYNTRESNNFDEIKEYIKKLKALKEKLEKLRNNSDNPLLDNSKEILKKIIKDIKDYLSDLNCQGLNNTNKKIMCSICNVKCINMILCCCSYKLCDTCYNNIFRITKKCPNCRYNTAFTSSYNDCVIKILPNQRIH